MRECVRLQIIFTNIFAPSFVCCILFLLLLLTLNWLFICLFAFFFVSVRFYFVPNTHTHTCIDFEMNIYSKCVRYIPSNCIIQALCKCVCVYITSLCTIMNLSRHFWYYDEFVGCFESLPFFFNYSFFFCCC